MKTLKGLAVSAGAAVGHVYCYTPQQLEAAEAYFAPGQEAQMLSAYETARDGAQRELTELAQRLGGEENEQAKIMLAHREILDDEELDEEIREYIAAQRWMPDYAVVQVYTRFSQMLAAAKDALIAARAGPDGRMQPSGVPASGKVQKESV